MKRRDALDTLTVSLMAIVMVFLGMYIMHVLFNWWIGAY